MSREWLSVFFAFVTLAMPAARTVSGQANAEGSPDLQAGFRLLYELRPVEARAEFDAWEAPHPDDPVGAEFPRNPLFLAELAKLDAISR